MKRLKICHITTVHNEGDIRIFHKMCVSLAANPLNQVYLIIPNATSRNEKGVEILSFVSDTENRKVRIKKAGQKALELANELKADIYHLHDPELLTIARKLKKQIGAKVVFDSHEDVPKQLLDKIWIPAYQRKLLSRVYERYERFVCARIDGVISVTPIICNRFQKFQKNVALIANYPDLEELTFSDKKNDFSRTICYVGGIFQTRGILELVQALDNTDIQLLLAGSFESEELEQHVKALKGWQNVTFLGQVGRNEIKDILEKSEIGVVTLHPTKSYVESYPIKLFEYMAAGIAILASDFPLWRTITDPAECANYVDPKNSLEIQRVLLKMLDTPSETRQMGTNGKIAVQMIYNWKSEFEKLQAFYHKLIEN
ncbi:MAG: glycosyltransferase family 4 protein [Bacteroidetes bacterium]|nr:glycosyltransferase family 4 protein [Bacteroidota bacterium]